MSANETSRCPIEFIQFGSRAHRRKREVEVCLRRTAPRTTARQYAERSATKSADQIAGSRRSCAFGSSRPLPAFGSSRPRPAPTDLPGEWMGSVRAHD